MIKKIVPRFVERRKRGPKHTPRWDGAKLGLSGNMVQRVTTAGCKLSVYGIMRNTHCFSQPGCFFFCGLRVEYEL